MCLLQTLLGMTLLGVSAGTVTLQRFDDLPFDVNDRLVGNWMVYKEADLTSSSNNLCQDSVFLDPSNWLHRDEVADLFSFAYLTDNDMKSVLQNELEDAADGGDGGGGGATGKGTSAADDAADSANTECFAVRLLPGTPRNLVHYPLPTNKFSSSSNSTMRDVSDWFYSFLATETGWMSYLELPLSIVWVDSTQSPSRRTKVGNLAYGDENTVWLDTRLGHTFEVEDAQTGEVIFKNRVLHDSYHIVGDLVFPDVPSGAQAIEDREDLIKHTLHEELARSRRVTRTFTETGFSLGDLPRDLFASMLTYYYNSYRDTYVEDWTGMVHINWWETASLLVSPPWALKGYWQSRLLPMVEAWIGGHIPLETSDIYGIRRYQDGARLLTHVDREETHAVSLIINLEQVEMREPWYIEVYDLNNYLHKVEMKPGNVVFYESARCLHGRMAPLRGASYSNIFSHYRPAGDPSWYNKENPPGATEPLPDFDAVCEAGGDKVQEDSGGQCRGGAASFTERYPHLIPEEPRIQHAHDLFKYWEKVGAEK